MTRYLVSAKVAPCAATTRDAIYNGVKVIAREGDYYESFSPGSLVIPSRGATVELDHDAGKVIGSVVCVAGSKDWIVADMVVEDPDAETLERLRKGTAVSLGARSLACDEDLHLGLKRHILCELEHIAITKRGQIGAFPGAVITRVKKWEPEPGEQADTGGLVVREEPRLLRRDCGTILGLR